MKSVDYFGFTMENPPPRKILIKDLHGMFFLRITNEGKKIGRYICLRLHNGEFVFIIKDVLDGAHENLKNRLMIEVTRESIKDLIRKENREINRRVATNRRVMRLVNIGMKRPPGWEEYKAARAVYNDIPKYSDLIINRSQYSNSIYFKGKNGFRYRVSDHLVEFGDFFEADTKFNVLGKYIVQRTGV